VDLAPQLLMDGGAGTLNSDVGGWMRSMVDTFGETGGALAIDVTMFRGLGLLMTPWILMLAWFSAPPAPRGAAPPAFRWG
jgi:hypothetical protein